MGMDVEIKVTLYITVTLFLILESLHIANMPAVLEILCADL